MDMLGSAIDRIRRWMAANGAGAIVENLASGASAEAIQRAEQAFGVTLPPDLRAMWTLHDGQKEEGDRFVEYYDLLSIERAITQQRKVLRCIEFTRETPERWAESGGTADELASEHWIPFASLDSDSLAVHGDTGRVFACPKLGDPELRAPSLASWFDAYANRVTKGDYRVETGATGYYIERR